MTNGVAVVLAVGLWALGGVAARGQAAVEQGGQASPDELKAQSGRAAQAQQRTTDASLDKQQAAAQRLAAPNPCAPTTEPVRLRVDRFGNIVTLAGTQERPLYVPSSLQVEVTGTPEEMKVLRDRTQQREDAGPVTTAEGDLHLSLPATASVNALSKRLIPGTPTTFTRAELAQYVKGGMVKLDVEIEGPAGAGRRTASTIWVIPYEPWTIVLNEAGLVDPRFRGSVSAAHMPCDPVLLYSPADPLTAPSSLSVTPPGAGQTPIVLDAEVCKTFQWPTAAGVVAQAVVDPKCPAQSVAPLEGFLTDGQAQMVVMKQGRGVAVISVTRRVPEPLQRALSTRERVHGPQNPESEIFPILLDRTGVASWQYLNRRRPPELSFETVDAYLRFRNNIPDRQFVVTFSGIAETERAELVRQGVDVANCRDGKCQASVRVPANGGAVLFPLVPLYNAFVKGGTGGVVSFQVAFFDEDTTPTNSRGYFSLVSAEQLLEAASATSWSAGASVTYQRDPDMSGLPFTPKGHKTPSLTFASPWDRLNRHHVVGSATLGVRQTLGTRADLDVELTVRKGDFGSDPSNVQASKYVANVYAVYPLTLTGGRYDLAVPTSGIAMTESGEAVSGTYLLPRNVVVSVGRIFRKEMPIGSFTLDEQQKVVAAGGSFLERNHQSTVLQVRDLFAEERFRLSVFGVIGDAARGEHYVADSATTPPTLALREFDVNYWTTGADMVLGVKKLFVSAGLYHSHKSEKRPVELPQRDEVSGRVGLVSVSYTNPDSKVVQGKQGIDWVLTGLVGAGGEYVGESQSFAPDVLFLNTFASALREPSVAIGRGLTNKWYFGGVWTTPQFGWIKAAARKVPFLANDINSSNLTFKLHQYMLRHAGDRSANLGTEANVEFRIESPKGVRYQLTVAGFEPGGALDTPSGVDSLIRKFQYAVRLGVTIRLE